MRSTYRDLRGKLAAESNGNVTVTVLLADLETALALMRAHLEGGTALSRTLTSINGVPLRALEPAFLTAPLRCLASAPERWVFFRELVRRVNDAGEIGLPFRAGSTLTMPAVVEP